MRGLNAIGNTMLTNIPAPEYSNGRESIEAVKGRREEAEAFRALAKDVENELAGI